MRIFAIGLGGAGCRIADILYGQDRHFSKVTCVEAIAIDRDPVTLNHLAHIPPGKRVYFPSVSLQTGDITDDITIDEIISLVHNLDTGDKDAIILCTGAGGLMAGTGVAILEKVRSTVVEPIFALVTLPATCEGMRISAKAAQDIDRIFPLVEGVIVFDNEKLAVQVPVPDTKAPRAAYKKLNPLSRPVAADNRQDRYKAVNTGIARRLGLLLKAGEISEEGEVETGEVVLDAGEILNTIRGMGFIAIGYSSADTSGEKFHIGSLFKPTGTSVESGHKKAEKLVDLAKKAIYENISVPCDLTSAEKALILVAGPSQAISMKGFMAIRKWIDRSIAGMEMRSGDYPVKNTRYIAIIIILAGLANIPRIKEIRAIRDEYTKEYPGWEEELHKQVKQLPMQTTTPSEGYGPGSKPAKSIPFFSRRKSTAGNNRTTPGGLVIDDKNTLASPVPERGTLHPGIEGEEKYIRQNQDLPAGAGTNSILQEAITNATGTPVSAGNEVKNPVEKKPESDLASVVARAREDLKKLDEKQ